jgi:hypothetical protein
VHSVPRTARPAGERINLTFRLIAAPAQAGEVARKRG